MTVHERGDESDFRAFAQRQLPRLFRLSVVLTGDHDRADDLTQQVLVRAYVHWRRIRRLDDPDAYLRRMLLNEHASFWRRRSNSELPSAAQDEPAEDRGFAEVDAAEEVRRLLVTLPPRQRAVLALRYLEDLTEAQTAAELGVSTGTVKSQHSKAVATLRRRTGSSAPLDAQSPEGREENGPFQ